MYVVETEPVQQERKMPRMDFAEIGMDMPALIRTVVQANLRAIQEFSQAKTPYALAELQRRYAAEYIAALHYGTMSVVSALGERLKAGTGPTGPEYHTDKQNAGAPNV